MATTVAELFAKIGFQIDAVTLDDAKRSILNLSDTIKNLVISSASTGAELKTLAKNIGIPIETIRGWEQLADSAGIATESVRGALKSLEEIRQSTLLGRALPNPFRLYLKDFSYEDLQNPSKALDKILDQLAQIKDERVSGQIFTELFGGEIGQAIQLIESYRQVGGNVLQDVSLSTGQVESLNKIEVSLLKINKAYSTLKDSIVSEFGASIVSLLDTVTGYINQTRLAIIATLQAPAVVSIKEKIASLMPFLVKIIATIKTTTLIVGALGSAILTIVGLVSSLTVFLGGALVTVTALVALGGLAYLTLVKIDKYLSRSFNFHLKDLLTMATKKLAQMFPELVLKINEAFNWLKNNAPESLRDTIEKIQQQFNEAFDIQGQLDENEQNSENFIKQLKENLSSHLKDAIKSVFGYALETSAGLMEAIALDMKNNFLNKFNDFIYEAKLQALHLFYLVTLGPLADKFSGQEFDTWQESMKATFPEAFNPPKYYPVNNASKFFSSSLTDNLLSGIGTQKAQNVVNNNITDNSHKEFNFANGDVENGKKVEAIVEENSIFSFENLNRLNPNITNGIGY